MSGIFSLLAVRKPELDTGTIIGKSKNGIIVRAGKETLVIKSATADALKIGNKVVIGQAGENKYIIGKEKSESGSILEVRVNG